MRKIYPIVQSDKEFETLENQSHRVAELFIEPFSHCNIDCDFCFQKMERDSGLLPDVFFYLNEAKNKLHKYNINAHFLEMGGGEIFLRNDQKYTDAYMSMMSEVSGVKKVTCITNLLFNIKNNKLYNAMKEQYKDVILLSSYNSTGRFKTKQQLKLFLNNVDYVLTNCQERLNLHVMITDDMLFGTSDLSILESLNNNPNIDIEFRFLLFSQYSDEVMDKFIPLMCKLIDRFPNLIDEGDKRKRRFNNPLCSCIQDKTRELFISYSDHFRLHKEMTCTHSLHSEGLIDYENFNKKDFRLHTINKLGCETCEYEYRCKERCPVFLASVQKHKGCVFKPLYQYMDIKNS